jgi:hypothetical protein
VEVVRHQASGKQIDTMHLHLLHQDAQKSPAISIVFEDRHFSVAAVHHVVRPARDVHSRPSTHAGT